MDENKPRLGSKFSFLMGLLAGFALIGVISLVGIIIVATDSGQEEGGKIAAVADNSADSNINQSQPAEPEVKGVATEDVNLSGITTFQAKQGAEICQENGKPIIYLFSTTGCPHCTWIKETFDSTMKEYINQGKVVAYHWEFDTSDNSLTSAVETSIPAEQQAIYQEFNPEGYVPAFIFGCKYFRIGTGHERDGSGLDGEKAEFEALIAELLK